ncbi:unnamed protein product [Paramecium sonneborni]|uniref:Phosphatidylinositol-4-phosphate 5-kinase n=1 Tax=Paramecium sonneborni TaxID=65129 RepID=A0A8S1RBU9_9CILI|nr:unnamed protein product [Paramecium sonneborni]
MIGIHKNNIQNLINKCITQSLIVKTSLKCKYYIRRIVRIMNSYRVKIRNESNLKTRVPKEDSVEENEEFIEKFKNYKAHNKQFEYGNLVNMENSKLKIYKDSCYFGQIANGKRNGKGVLICNNGRIYEGNFENNRKHGQGYEQLPDNCIYEGMYINGKPEGMGKFIWDKGEYYEGSWLNGLKHGQGIWIGVNNDSYIGEWKMGNTNGYGVYIAINGDKYEGEFHNNLKHGQGIEYLSNGDIYKGYYVNGKPEGQGEYFWNLGSYYNGTFKNGQRHGRGNWIKDKNAQQSDCYEGEYVNDKKCGFGIYRWPTGSRYEGNFFEDLRHGFGKMFWEDGSYYYGMWDKGNQCGEGEYCKNGEQTKFGIFEKNVLIKEDFEKVKRQPPQIKIRQYTTSQKTVRSNSQQTTNTQKPQINFRPNSVKQPKKIILGQIKNAFQSKQKRQFSLHKQTIDLNF